MGKVAELIKKLEDNRWIYESNFKDGDLDLDLMSDVESVQLGVNRIIRGPGLLESLKDGLREVAKSQAPGKIEDSEYEFTIEKYPDPRIPYPNEVMWISFVQTKLGRIAVRVDD